MSSVAAYTRGRAGGGHVESERVHLCASPVQGLRMCVRVCAREQIARTDVTSALLQDRCAHGRGSLAAGDIEDIEPSAVACGRLPAKSACVRCPRHRSKFAGGLWYSLETGASLTLGPTVTPPVPPVVALARRFEGSCIGLPRCAQSDKDTTGRSPTTRRRTAWANMV